jgi:hypothetical protein
MQPSCPGLSLVTRAGFMVMMLRQRNNPPNGKAQGHRDRKRRDTVKSKVKSMLIIFFDIKGIVNNEFALAGQTVSSAYYYNVLRRLHENVRRPRPKLWLKENWLLHHNNALSHTSFLTRNFLPKKHGCCPPPIIHFSVSQLKIKLKGSHFDTIEVIESESQSELNTFTEHDFRMHLKMSEALGTVRVHGRGQLRGC